VALSLEAKRPRREADHSPPSSTEVKNSWICTSTLPIHFHGVMQTYGQLYFPPRNPLGYEVVYCCGRIPTFQRFTLKKEAAWTSETLVSYHKIHGIRTQLDLKPHCQKDSKLATSPLSQLTYQHHYHHILSQLIVTVCSILLLSLDIFVYVDSIRMIFYNIRVIFSTFPP
jgi:hypothetical protein